MADAAALLARRYTLQATNVPYLGRGKQAPPLADYLSNHFGDARADLATAMLSRMLHLSASGGTIAIVILHNWLFLKPIFNSWYWREAPKAADFLGSGVTQT